MCIVSKAPREGPLPDEEADGASKYVDTTSFEALQELLEQVHQEQERLIGTAAHLSHELDISKEHVKVNKHTLCVLRLIGTRAYRKIARKLV